MTLHHRYIITFLSAFTCCKSYAFNTPHSNALHRSYTLPLASDQTIFLKLSSDDYNDFNDAQFFDDFGDALLGNSQSNNDVMMSSLQSKMSQTREIEAAHEAKLERNWRKGNWSVRGFALAKDGPSQTPSINEQNTNAVHVSTVAAPISASLSSSSLLRDETLSEDRTIAVGRTDGSVFLVQLGNEYLTKFAPSQKLVVNENDEEISVSVNEEWTKQKQIDQDGEKKMQPFEVLLNFQSSESGEECHSIAFHDVSEQTDNNGYICTAAGDSGVIKLWALPFSYRGPGAGQKLQPVSLTGAHQDRIVALKTIVVSSSNVDGGEEHLLISASRDGVIAFWDLNKNEKLLFSSPCISGRELTCVDVYNPSLDSSYFASDEKAEHDMMYFGTSDGYVVGYDIQTVLDNGECTEPDISFRAHGVDSGKGEGITAIKCGGDEATPTSGNAVKVTSTILLTGGEDGSVKQWLVLLYFLRSLRTKMKMSFSR